MSGCNKFFNLSFPTYKLSGTHDKDLSVSWCLKMYESTNNNKYLMMIINHYKFLFRKITKSFLSVFTSIPILIEDCQHLEFIAVKRAAIAVINSQRNPSEKQINFQTRMIVIYRSILHDYLKSMITQKHFAQNFATSLDNNSKDAIYNDLRSKNQHRNDYIWDIIKNAKLTTEEESIIKLSLSGMKIRHIADKLNISQRKATNSKFYAIKKMRKVHVFHFSKFLFRINKSDF